MGGLAGEEQEKKKTTTTTSLHPSVPTLHPHLEQVNNYSNGEERRRQVQFKEIKHTPGGKNAVHIHFFILDECFMHLQISEGPLKLFFPCVTLSLNTLQRA